MKLASTFSQSLMLLVMMTLNCSPAKKTENSNQNSGPIANSVFNGMFDDPQIRIWDLREQGQIALAEDLQSKLKNLLLHSAGHNKL